MNHHSLIFLCKYITFSPLAGQLLTFQSETYTAPAIDTNIAEITRTVNERLCTINNFNLVFGGALNFGNCPLVSYM